MMCVISQVEGGLEDSEWTTELEINEAARVTQDRPRLQTVVPTAECEQRLARNQQLGSVRAWHV